MTIRDPKQLLARRMVQRHGRRVRGLSVALWGSAGETGDQIVTRNGSDLVLLSSAEWLATNPSARERARVTGKPTGRPASVVPERLDLVVEMFWRTIRPRRRLKHVGWFWRADPLAVEAFINELSTLSRKPWSDDVRRVARRDLDNHCQSRRSIYRFALSALNS